MPIASNDICAREKGDGVAKQGLSGNHLEVVLYFGKQYLEFGSTQTRYSGAVDQRASARANNRVELKF